MFTSPARQVPPPIFIADALAMLKGNLQLLKTVVQVLIDQSTSDMAAIPSDAVANNSTALAASSHRLQGSLAAIAEQPAYQASSALNKLARASAAGAYATGLTHMEDELGLLQLIMQARLADKPMN